MHQPTVLSALALVAGLALTGCSGSTADSTATSGAESSAPAPSPSASATADKRTYELDQAFYAQTPYGSHITVDFTAQPPAEVEDLREQLGVAPVSYAKVDLDNRDGTEAVGIYKVVFFDEEGQSYEFNDLSIDHIGEWGPNYTDSFGGVDGEYGYVLNDGTVLEEAAGDELNSRSTDLYNEYLDGTGASRHEKTQGWIASTDTELPERITAIEVWPGGIIEDPIYMVPVGEKGSYEVAPSTAPEQEQSEDEAEAELAQWKEDGADCADEVLAELGSKAKLAAAIECTFGEETTEPGGPADESDGVGIPGPTELPMPGGIPNQGFTYEEAYAAWESGMPYYDAFCIHYEPVTPGGVSQCEGIEAGTVDSITGEYIGG